MKENLADNYVHDILRYFDQQNLFSPQVKRSVIISKSHGIYDLRHELPNNLRLTILVN